MPAAVPGFTSTFPVAESKTSCAGTVEPVAKLRFTFANDAGAEFNVSLVKAFTTAAAPEAPLMPVALSLVAMIGAAPTFTVIVAILQFVGLRISQIWYLKV